MVSLGNERLTRYKKITIRCVILAWFALVFVAYYVSFFSKISLIFLQDMKKLLISFASLVQELLGRLF